MRRLAVLAVLGLYLGVQAAARGAILEDITSGKLISPEVGIYAWYELTDSATKQKMFLRQAVVGEEKVKRKTGFWVETEIIPQVGFPAVYKMLLTGPANEEGNIHRLMVREGQDPPKEIPVEQGAGAPAPKAEKRTSVGKESVKTVSGPVDAEHVTIQQGDKKIEVWLNDAVRPLGIVRMITPEGELILQRYGKGGPDGGSHIDALAPLPSGGGGDVKVETEVGKPVLPVPGKPAEAAGEQPAPAEPAKKNFGGKKKKE